MISPGDTIVIAGDSWGCGEWAVVDKKYAVVHKGLEQYLIDYGCEVINVSVPGNSNIISANALKDAVSQFNPSYCFWFQTDPMRDLRPYDPDTFPRRLSELHLTQYNKLVEVYKLLSEIDMPVHCMGGTVKLNLHLLSAHDNLVPLIPSIIEMFGGPDIQCWVSEWIQHPNIKFTFEFIKEISQLPHKLPKKWFYPDGYHPNRLAHKQIFEYILAYHK